MNQEFAKYMVELMRQEFKNEFMTIKKEFSYVKNELANLSLELEILRRGKESQESTANHAEFYTSIQQQLTTVERPNWLNLENKTIPVNPITHDIGSVEEKLMDVLCDMIQNEYCDVVDTHKNGIIGNRKPYITLFPKTIDVSSLLIKGCTPGIIPLCLGFIEGKSLFNPTSGKIVPLGIDEKGQALFYACRVLELFPSLFHCMIALTNYEQIIFMKAIRKSHTNSIAYLETKPFQLFNHQVQQNDYTSKGWSYLYSMLKTCVTDSQIVIPSEKDLKDTKELRGVKKLPISKFLGKGNTLIVYGVSGEGVVAKMFYRNKEKHIANECKIIEFLKGKMIGNLPEILLKRDSFMLMKSYSMVLSPSTAQAEALIELLKKVHQAGILHRDIRPDNIMQDSQGLIVLIDWGFALSKSEAIATGFYGTISFASQRYLDDSSYYEEIDDCESLLKYFYYCDNKEIQKKVYDMKDKNQHKKILMVGDIWGNIQSECFTKALKEIRSGDSDPYNALLQFVRTYHEKDDMRRGMNEIFSMVNNMNAMQDEFNQ